MALPAASSLQKPTIWSPAFTVLLAANFLACMGQSVGGTLVPLYVDGLGATSSLVGFAGGCFAITALLVRPFAGPAFDSFSKKRLLLASVALIGASVVAYALVTSVSAIIAVRLLHGVGIGCSAPLALALATDTLPRERMTSGVSVFSLSQAAAQAIGPAFSIWFSRRFSYEAAFLLTACAILASLAVIALFVREQRPDGRPPYRLSLSRAFALRALGPTAVLTLLAMAFTCTHSFVAVYGALRGVDQIGLYFTVYAGCLLATRPLFGRLSEKVGAVRVFIPAVACFMVSFVLISRAQTFPAFVLAAVVGSCGFGVCMPLTQALAIRSVSAAQRGSASNTVFAGMDLGNLLGPLCAGHAVEYMVARGATEVAAYANMWLVMLVFVAAGLMLFVLLQPRLARYAAEAQAPSERTPKNEAGGRSALS